MRMTREAGADGPLISGFSGRGFRIDGNVYRNLLITPDRADSWSPPPIDLLDEAALTPILTIDPLPEFILIGTGRAMLRPPQPLLARLETRGIGVEAMDSRAAARAWGVLRAEERWIAGAFYEL